MAFFITLKSPLMYDANQKRMMMSALVEFAMFPTEKTESKSAFVARVLDIVDKSGLPYQLTPIGTIIEAETVGEHFAVIEAAYAELQEDCSRMYSAFKFDFRRGPVGGLDNLSGWVEEYVGSKLNT
jgi:uncharacterized protein YqgV (UPF0045/DUF77 family)